MGPRWLPTVPSVARASGPLLVAALSLGPVIAGPPSPAETSAAEILSATGVQGGLVVHIGCGDGQLTAALRAGEAYLVHGLASDTATVESARAHVRSLGLLGPVSIDHWSGARLPYVDNLVNLLVAGEPGEVSRDEMMRVLVPGGVAYLRDGDRWTKTVKPWPGALDEWTHYLHDSSGNAVSQDRAIGPPRRQQWIGSPRWSRHHDHMASMSALVSSGGRIFYILDEGPTSSILLPSRWALIGRDAFNGTVLWKRPIARWHTRLWPLKSGPAKLPRRLVALGDTVWTTPGMDAPLVALDASSGETRRTYEGSAGADEIVVRGDTVLVAIDPDPSPGSGYTALRDVRRGVTAARWAGGERTLAAYRRGESTALWRKATRMVTMTLAADGERAYYHDGEKIVALDRTSGERRWTSTPLPVWASIQSWFAPTLVVYEDVVLFAGGEKMVPHRGGDDTVTAVSASTGETLWTAEHAPGGYQSPEDLLVAGGLVWSGATTNGGYSGVFTGRDPRTGEVKKQFGPDVESYWFHHRCYRAKATEQFLLTSRTGIEFIDLDRKSWEIHHWVRGGCLYGILPANGLIYTPPHDCACYPEAKLFGFNALAPAAGTAVPHADAIAQAGPRLERSPTRADADALESSPPAAEDWPTYRHDPGRSGSTPVTVAADLAPVWELELGVGLSSPVIADGRLYVAAVDAHTLHVLDAASGERRWSYTAGGRIDSPPTVHGSRVLFGSADGYVTSLRAADGASVWRFRAAPAGRRLVAFEQVESVWPVSGSVLVRDDQVYCVAGRSMFLDGGMRLCRLDAATGRLLSETVLDDRDPVTGESLQARLQILNMPVALPDVLSSRGDRVYMRSQTFDLEGRRMSLGPHSGKPVEQGSVQGGEAAHLFSPTGFLDGTWFHRSYWVYGRSFAGGHAGYYQAGKFTPAGRILVHDESSVYGFGRKPRYYRWTSPIEHHLFATDREAPEVDRRALRRGATDSMIRVPKTPALNPAGKPVVVDAWVLAKGPNGVVVARGGPSHGYALVLRGGRPQFAVRVEGEIDAVTARERVVNRWVHLVGALTAEKALQIWIDGQLAAEGKARGFVAADPAQGMEVGADDGGPVGDYRSPFGLTGRIDEVRVYHGRVSAADIARHAAAPGPIALPGAELVLGLSFENGEAGDASSHGHHGAIAGARPVEGKFGGAMAFVGGRGGAEDYFVKHRWSRAVPILVRAMVLANDILFVAGPPDLVDEEEVVENLNDPEIEARLAKQAEALEGRGGARLLAVSSADGKTLGELFLDAPPRWDGMAAAGGRLYLATTDGKIRCFSGRR